MDSSPLVFQSALPLNYPETLQNYTTTIAEESINEKLEIIPRRVNGKRLKLAGDDLRFSVAIIDRKPNWYYRLQYYLEALFGTRYAPLGAGILPNYEDTPLINIRSLSSRLHISTKDAKDLIKTSTLQDVLSKDSLINKKTQIAKIAVSISPMIQNNTDIEHQAKIQLIARISKHAIYTDGLLSFCNDDKQICSKLMTSYNNKSYLVEIIAKDSKFDNIMIRKIGEKVLASHKSTLIVTLGSTSVLKLPKPQYSRFYSLNSSFSQINLKLQRAGLTVIKAQKFNSHNIAYSKLLLAKSKPISIIDGESGLLLYALEMAKGKCDLHNYMTKHALSMIQKVTIANQLITQLNQMYNPIDHSCILHGDIKPENIMIMTENQDDVTANFGDFDDVGFTSNLDRLNCHTTEPSSYTPHYTVENLRVKAHHLLKNHDHINAAKLFMKLDKYALGCSLFELFQNEHCRPDQLEDLVLSEDVPQKLRELIMDMIDIRE